MRGEGGIESLGTVSADGLGETGAVEGTGERNPPSIVGGSKWNYKVDGLKTKTSFCGRKIADDDEAISSGG